MARVTPVGDAIIGDIIMGGYMSGNFLHPNPTITTSQSISLRQ